MRDYSNSELEALEDVVVNFLIERVGVLKFRLPETEQSNRAILALYDAVGRNP